MSELGERLGFLLDRLHTVYDGLGHSSGRPFVYFVYPPDQDRAVRRLADDQLRSNANLTFYHLDVGLLTIESLKGQEERRDELLENAMGQSGAAQSIVRVWARGLSKEITRVLTELGGIRPVIVLRGLAALHPLGNPTQFMEALAEQEPRDAATGRIVPIIVLVPGVRPPATSRTYLFLGREDLRLEFYRGEEA